MIGRPLRRLRDDCRGVTIVEFAVVAPVMILLIMGLGELTYEAYVRAIVDGAVQKAARDSAIEGGADDTVAIDNMVLDQVRSVAKDATYKSKRLSYTSFSDIKPERFIDSNGNGFHDANECFDDINGNKRWDAKPGRETQGGADDVTVYTFSLTYRRLFPVMALMGWDPQATADAKTILKNQPYAGQTTYEVVRICP